MTKNKVARYIANTAVVAVMAAAGIGVYQLGTTPSEKKEIRNESENILSDEPDQKKEEQSDTAENRETEELQSVIKKETETQSVGNTFAVAKQSESEVNKKNPQEDQVISKAEAKDVSASATAAAAKLSFSEDTLMEWPVEGGILRDYNMNQTVYYATLDQYKLSPSIIVDAEEGDPVTCSVKGKVYSVNEDAQTGTTLTMEIGNGYQAIYGQLKDVTVQKGDTVEKGTVIGYINKPTRYYSREGSNLYFAMKKNGEPVDPIVYLP